MRAPSEQTPVRWSGGRVVAAVLLLMMLVAGAALVFLPIGWQLNRFVVWLYHFNRNIFGIRGISLDGYAFVLNVLLFFVPTVLLTVVFPRVRRWVWPLLGFCLSLGIETVQWRYLPREAGWDDVVANTLGACLGAVCLNLWRHFRTQRAARRLGTR
ncbi:VanZ family protein [uncultured Tessaracoccus sp.]|uniref:VanZ family protein n=1 Tax=uncultured Tessaracoccus sp. TaxID=905023 RepID=UPI002632D103|nr:VanZ family protein [uncultured Tessaracoccus sp.]